MPSDTTTSTTAAPDNVIQFRPAHGLTDAECNTAMAAMRPVLTALCGALGERASITMGMTDTDERYVSAVVETEYGELAWTVLRTEGRFVLVGPDGLVGSGRTLDGALLAVTGGGASR